MYLSIRDVTDVTSSSTVEVIHTIDIREIFDAYTSVARMENDKLQARCLRDREKRRNESPDQKSTRLQVSHTPISLIVHSRTV